MMRFVFGALGTLFLSQSAWALPFKCDKNQDKCEIVTKRWTIGDKIGVFSGDKHLVAIGEVIEIRDQKRIVRVTKKWSTLLRSHDMDIIPDAKYSDPEKSFSIITPLPPFNWAADLGMVILGVGDGFISTEVSGGIYRRFWKDISWMARLHYLTGSGKASDNLGNAGSQSVNVSSFGLTAGLSEMILPYNVFSFRIDGELGVSNVSVTLGGDFNEDDVLNSRVSDGIGIYARASAAAIWRRDGLQPEFGLAFLKLHNTVNPSIFVGVNAPIP
jgi:hypothetical protein